MSAAKKRIAIIEPSPMLRAGFRSLIESCARDMAVVAEYRDLAGFGSHPSPSAFDIIVVNPALFDFQRRANPRDLLAGHPNAAVAALVHGYVDLQSLASFDGAIDICQEGTAMARKLGKIAESARQGDGQTESTALSEREREILVAVARGMTNKAIAESLSISVHTVISHRKNITRKTGIKTVSGLTIYAVFNNLVPQGEL